MQATEPQYISVEEAGKMLGLKRARAYQVLVKNLNLAVRISSRRVLVPIAAMQALQQASIQRARAGGLAGAQAE